MVLSIVVLILFESGRIGSTVICSAVYLTSKKQDQGNYSRVSGGKEVSQSRVQRQAQNPLLTTRRAEKCQESRKLESVL